MTGYSSLLSTTVETWIRRFLFDAKRFSHRVIQHLLSGWRRPLSRDDVVEQLTDYVISKQQPAPLPISTYQSTVQPHTELHLQVLNDPDHQGESQISFDPDWVWDIQTGGKIHHLSLTASGAPLLNGRTLLDLDYGTVAGLKDWPIKTRHQHYPVVIAPWSHFFGRYYTYTLSILTKLCRIKASMDPTVWQTAKFCYPHFSTSYELEYLKKLGIPAENVIDTRPQHLRISADRMLLANNQMRVNRISPLDITLLRQTFLPTETVHPQRRLFFPRRGRRVLKNEAELRDLLEQYGFETIEDVGRSVDEQIALFQSASHIVAIHGAGLANLVWCRPQTHVVELFYRGYTKPGFYYLARLLDLKYDCLFDNSTVSDSFSNRFRDLDLDPAALKTLLQRIG